MSQIFALNWRAVTCLLFVNFVFSICAYPKGGGTPYSVFYGIWLEHVKDSTEFTLLTVIPDETLSEISPLLKKALKVKSDITCDSAASVGITLTRFLKEKYGKKSNEKNDFFAIQYSTISRDFENYLEKWPNSKSSEEAKSRYNCFKANELWQIANEIKTRDAYESFAKYTKDTPVCQYEGCQRISELNYNLGTAIIEWFSLIDSSSEQDYSIYKAYLSYIEKYGEYSLFGKEAMDSLRINKDRYDWDIAVKENTSGAYKEYIENHNRGRHVWEAKAILKELELWNIAATSDMYNDYCKYYSEYPDGKFASKAADKIKQHEESVWEATKKKNSLKAYEEFVKEYPSGFYASEAQNLTTKL